MKPVSQRRNFRVPLPEKIYKELHRVALKSKRPATQLARDAIEHWLDERRKGNLQREIEVYAQKHAGDSFDLDVELEEAARKLLLSRK